MRLIAAQPINNTIDTLQAEITSEIDSRKDSQSLSSLVSIQSLRNITERLQKIRKIINSQRYNLVFIGQVGAGKMKDGALEFAMGFAIDQYDEFNQELIKRGQLSERTKTEIYPAASDLDQRAWLSQVFQSLNVAKLPNFSIPKRIYLNLSRCIRSRSRNSTHKSQY